jgi:hypothetical protein
MEEENLPLENKWCFWFDKGQKQKLGGVSMFFLLGVGRAADGRGGRARTRIWSG